jgi:hypothetical protein
MRKPARLFPVKVAVVAAEVSETNLFRPAYDYTNGLWLEITDWTNAALLTLHGTEEGQSYEILVETNLNQTSWDLEQTIFGPAGTNVFSTIASRNGRESMFFTLKAPSMSRVETPFFDPAPGSYVSSQTVRVFDATTDATIYYTTNGAIPTTNDAVIASGESMTVFNTAQFKAKAWKSGMLPSSVGEGGYTFYLPAPSLNPAGGVYGVGQAVSIYGAPSGATIHYTTNGDEPTISSPEIANNDSLTLSSSITLKAKMFKSGQESGVSTAVYQIQMPPANDDLANAQIISGKSGSVPGTLIGATTESAEESFYSDNYYGLSVGQSVWYEWTSPTNGTVLLDFLGSEYTPLPFIFEGTNWNNFLVLHDTVFTPVTRTISFPVTAATTYEFAVQPNYYDDLTIYSGNFVLNWTMESQVATPTFSPEGGTYNTNQFVSIGCTTPTASIHYTLNGNDPTEGDPVVLSGQEIEIDSSYTLKAKAWREGLTASSVKSSSYTIDTNETNITLVVSKPQFVPASTNFVSNVVVTVTCSTPGAEIHYTTNGSEPTESDSTIASGSTITLNGSQVLKSKAWNSGMNASSIQTATYAKNGEDNDFDSIPDEWELAHGSSVFGADDLATSNEPFAHGLNNLQVFENQSILISDNYSTMNDGVSDWWKVKYGISINDPSGSDARGANGMTMAQNFKGGFNPLNANQRSGTMPKVHFRIVHGPENNVFLKVDTILPNVTKYELYFYLSHSDAIDLPPAFANGRVNMVEFTPSPENPDNIFQIPTNVVVGENSIYQFFLKAIDKDGRESEFRLVPVGSVSLTSFHDFAYQNLTNHIAMNEEKMKWQMRFRMAPPPAILPHSSEFEYDFYDSYTYAPQEEDLWFEADFSELLYPNPLNPEWMNIGRFNGFFWGISDEDDPTIYNLGIDLAGYGFSTNSSGGHNFARLASGKTNYYGLQYLGFTIQSLVDSTEVVVTPGNDADITGLQSDYRVFSDVEQPAFLPTEYYFGGSFWGDYIDAAPPSTEYPYGQGQTNPLMVASVGSTYTLQAWSKLAIYPPGSGTPVPDRYGYIEQYWDKAYLCDPATGDVPRTGEDNVGGKKKINTATAIQTGLLSPFGEFTPTKPGKVILTTQPDSNGLYGECVVYVIDMKVDSNHDGVMDDLDFTSQDRPFTFWVNNDIDRGHTVDVTDFEEDDLSEGVADWSYQTNGNYAIPCKRDLEDYARLSIAGLSNLVSALPAGYSVKLLCRTNSGAAIRVFKAAESDGGTNYLFDDTVAESQIDYADNPCYGNVGAYQNIDLIDAFGTNTPTDHFIFCGAGRGLDELVVQVSDENGNVVGEDSVFLKLKDIKEMYERWSVGDNGDVAPLTTAQIVSDPGLGSYQYNQDQIQQANTPYILFVHGWNMPTVEKDHFAETAYKRLYWQSYSGRFGVFHWPTYYAFPFGEFSSQAFDPRNYDNSESNAWTSATGLLKKLSELNAQYPNQVYLAAHSMGNVVAGEAMRLATNQVVNTYVALQGAVPSHTYDPNTPERPLTSFHLDWDSGTPNCYASYWTNDTPCYFHDTAGAGTYVNFYNTNDWALRLLWTLDQDSKPDDALTGYPGYHYSTSSGFYKITGASTNNLHILNFPTDTYEIFSFCDEARCQAIGRQRDVGGKFEDNQVGLDAAPYSFGEEHKYHSGQFRSNNQNRWQFWDAVLGNFGIQK